MSAAIVSALGQPGNSEFELSVFGAGVGEALAIHLGDGEWILVDSCRDQLSKTSAACAYLQAIGVPPNAVSTIVATHWHEDHVGKIDDLIKEYPSAKLVIPKAFESDQFIRMILAGAEPETLGSDALQTSRSFKAALTAAKTTSTKIGIATCNYLIRRKSVNAIGEIELHAISPSDRAISLALLDFDKFNDADLKKRRRPVAINPNHAAIAIWLKWGSRRVLLGSDLEISPDPLIGWKSAITSQILNGETIKASLVKAAHHGSINGHDSNFWAAHVRADTILLTTHSSSNLPRETDVGRLKALTDEVYCAPLPIAKPAKQNRLLVDQSAAQQIKFTPRSKRRFGHIRIRMSPAGQISKSIYQQAGKIVNS